MFTPARLRLARLRKGLSLTGLSKESGISLRSLTSYENGHQPPSDENVRKLAEVLAVAPAFFERDPVDPVPIEAASFRKLSKTSARRRDAVLATAALTVEFYAAIEERFRLPEPSIPTYDKLGPAEAAETLRQLWSLGDRPIGNLVHLLESKGVRIASLNHDYIDIDAFCFYRDDVPYIFLNTSKTAERQRFDLAHELGHLVLHSDVDMEAATSKEREVQAHAFAASFLMPASAVLSQSMRAASIERILVARSYWKVSAKAMTHRLHQLGLLSDWQHRSAYITLNERGYNRAEPGGIVPETSQLLRKVMYGGGTSVSVRDAAEAIALFPNEVRDYVKHLVPLRA
ncbi:XRE family transcriptional regulator [Leekyejoonella antrihumi]|uniref:ImmA/IrrE family metallo-endopeptidase n=1 Tax=Leekyejoonella antrihumi TaxID=1660198 RepID=A0A563DUJ6_9MICO|nr:ImmA/IrrE family metallo-endopeptidase [Leekyejoonella antrihumi]TWP33603.1 ImmA/IrrE family metallo-endopeptidase [Leekyejoonella antrihumi]